MFRPARGARISGHPSGEMLSAYVDGELERDVRAEVETHLRGCDSCRLKVQQFRSDSDLFQRVPVQRVPISMRRDLYRRIEEQERRRRVFPWFGLSLPNANALALGVTGVLLVVMTPQLLGVWSVIASGGLSLDRTAAQAAATPTDPSPTALALSATTTFTESQETPVAPLMQPSPASTSGPAATPGEAGTNVAPTSTTVTAPATPTMAPPVATLVPTQAPQTASGLSVGAPPAGASPTVAAGSTSQIAAGTSATEQVTSRPPSPSASTPIVVPTTTTPPVNMRSVSGQVAAVDRKQRVLTLQALQATVGAESGARTVAVQVSEGTLVTGKDGRPLTFEDLGFADLVEVSGFELSTGPLMAARVKVTQSAVAQVVTRPKVLVLLDGAPNLRAPQFHFTGDWVKRLQETGYDVTAVDPSSFGTGSADFKDFSLITIGYPATLSDALIRSVKASRLPVLNADPRLVQTLGLGLNADPTQPAKNIAGRSVEVNASGGAVTRGYSGDTIVGGDLYRMPIVANGTVLATIADGSQKRAVWSLSGNVMYFGFWHSANGQNHNATYWTLFDRSVLLLLGKDPLVAPTPVATR
ncbi:MAG TPA: zf-HC2 domain-containing protein [Chloroflexota bacterium]|nr:zf-HC2 domain-containing protein [Chloroflexota bacterium]